MTGSSDSFRNVTRYQGQDYSFAPRYLRNRDPHSPTNASNDIKPKEQQGYYPTGSLWTNTTNGNLWALQRITANLANWILLSSSSGPLLNIEVPVGITPIVPDAGGTVTFTSTNGTITITGSSAAPNNNFINFDVVGGGTPVDEIVVDANSPPGTNPVIANASGQIAITGAQVAAGGVGTNVIRTDSLAANTFTIEIQRTTAAAVSTVADNGVSHFDSARFTVDANGFVSTNGSGIVKWNIISASQTLAINNGYICVSPGGALALALPAASVLGDIIEVTLNGATSWTITQAAGQSIVYNNLTTTVGVGGSLASTDQGNTIRMVCQTANLKWNVLSALGTLTVT